MCFPMEMKRTILITIVMTFFKSLDWKSTKYVDPSLFFSRLCKLGNARCNIVPIDHNTTDGEGCSVADIDGDFDLDYIWSNNSYSFIFVNNNNFTYSLKSAESIG